MQVKFSKYIQFLIFPEIQMVLEAISLSQLRVLAYRPILNINAEALVRQPLPRTTAKHNNLVIVLIVVKAAHVFHGRHAFQIMEGSLHCQCFPLPITGG